MTPPCRPARARPRRQTEAGRVRERLLLSWRPYHLLAALRVVTEALAWRGRRLTDECDRAERSGRRLPQGGRARRSIRSRPGTGSALSGETIDAGAPTPGATRARRSGCAAGRPCLCIGGKTPGREQGVAALTDVLDKWSGHLVRSRGVNGQTICSRLFASMRGRKTR